MSKFISSDDLADINLLGFSECSIACAETLWNYQMPWYMETDCVVVRKKQRMQSLTFQVQSCLHLGLRRLWSLLTFRHTVIFIDWVNSASIKLIFVLFHVKSWHLIDSKLILLFCFVLCSYILFNILYILNNLIWRVGHLFVGQAMIYTSNQNLFPHLLAIAQ